MAHVLLGLATSLLLGPLPYLFPSPWRVILFCLLLSFAQLEAWSLVRNDSYGHSYEMAASPRAVARKMLGGGDSIRAVEGRGRGCGGNIVEQEGPEKA